MVVVASAATAASCSFAQAAAALLSPASTRCSRCRLKDENVALSLPSQRVDRFDDDIAHIVTNSAKRSGLTFAPEAGTQVSHGAETEEV